MLLCFYLSRVFMEGASICASICYHGDSYYLVPVERPGVSLVGLGLFWSDTRGLGADLGWAPSDNRSTVLLNFTSCFLCRWFSSPFFLMTFLLFLCCPWSPDPLLSLPRSLYVGTWKGCSELRPGSYSFPWGLWKGRGVPVKCHAAWCHSRSLYSEFFLKEVSIQCQIMSWTRQIQHVPFIHFLDGCLLFGIT